MAEDRVSQRRADVSVPRDHLTQPLHPSAWSAKTTAVGDLRSKRHIRRSQHSRIYKDARGRIADAISIRDSGAIPMRQADWKLRRTDSCRGFQCGPSTIGTHQQARQHSAAVSVGGGSSSGRSFGSRLEASVHPPGDASAKEHCEGGDGTQAGGSVVLDVAKRVGRSAISTIRFVRGRARYRTWCELNTVYLSGHPAPCKGSLN